MERILSVSQMRKADDFTINTLGFSSEELIERAGSAVASEITSRFRGGRVLVCIGKGNNGEDGKVVAKILSRIHGFSVSTLNVYNGFLRTLDKKYDIIVDCIFGTGLNKEVTDNYKKAIEKINQSGAFIVSCDIPSGLNGDTGVPMGIAVKANLTVAIQEYKLGHFLNDGPDYSGEIIQKDIGISVWDDDYVQRIGSNDASKFFQPLKRNVNKGSFPRITLIGGSKDYTGSAFLALSALCALKSGAGYSTLCVPKSVHGFYAGKYPECIIKPFSDDGDNFAFNKEELDGVLSSSVIAVGMGMGNNKSTYQIIEYLLSEYEGKLLIDADGLNALATFGKEILKNKKCKVVLTPHVGEFSRLKGVKKEEIINNSIKIAREFAKEYSVTLVLKSAITIISDGEQTYINTTGTSGMAKAGSGDVLSGFSAGLMGRSSDNIDALVVSCYVFGKAGELAKLDYNDYVMTASDISSRLSSVINNL